METPKIILITGASSGLGAALAEAYAAPGITLLLCGRDKTRLEEVATQCMEIGASVHTGVFDIANREATLAWVAAMDREHPVDLVIANAGVSAGTGGKNEALEQVEHLFAVNVSGVFYTLHPLLEAMEKRKKGQVAIMGSLAGFRGLPSSPAYSASKAAVRVYGEALRGYYLKKGIKVTVICPGYIKTPMTDVNSFPMPLLMTAAKAASYIKQKLSKAPARVSFPFPMFFIVWLMSVLPPGLTDPLFSRLPGKPSFSRPASGTDGTPPAL